MGKKRHGHYSHINGVPRNQTPQLTAEELRDMSKELKVTRHTDGLTEYERRLDYLRKRRGG